MTTGNPVRDALLRQAIETAGRDLAAVQAALPADFGTDQAELDAMLATFPPDAAAEQSSGDRIEGEHRADTLTLQEAQAALAEWQHKTQLARNALRDSDIGQRNARGKLVEAINFFLNGPPMTREQLIREHLASEQARRASGETRRRPSHGPSVVDIGRAGHGGSVNRRYAPTRRGIGTQRAYSLEGAIARSGGGTIDTGGRAPMPSVKSE